MYILNLHNVMCPLYLNESGKKGGEGILVSRRTLKVGHRKGPEEWAELALTASKEDWTRPGRGKVMKSIESG